MTARSIRRAIERKAQKQARKENARLEAAAVEISPMPSSEISEAQLAANRQNALLSTGPKTPEGKAKSSLNAVKTGLTGRTVLLPTEDAELYGHHVDGLFREWNPANEREAELVQRLADTRWRVARIPGLEAAIYALARIEFAGQFSDYPAAEAAALIQAHTFLVYQKQLNNLSIQESRLNRQLDRDTKELRQLQSERKAAEKPVTPAKPRTNGFEFSTLPQYLEEEAESLLNPPDLQERAFTEAA